jgi:sugar lactone lactonase YvrE
VLELQSVTPTAGVPGGYVLITCAGFDASNYTDGQVLFGDSAGRIVSASATRVVVAIPEDLTNKELTAGIRLLSGGRASNLVPFSAAELLADNLHPVASPAVDPENGTIYTTLSGGRGKKVDVAVWRIGPEGKAVPFVDDLMNPTGLAFDRDGVLFITSRHDGTVYRVTPFRDVEPFAKNLGVATGIAIDRKGTMYVGDRQGTIYRIDRLGSAVKFAEIEPSLAAYHLALGPDGNLYVTAPTPAGSRETIHRITPLGKVSTFFRGLGRPQGLAFDTEGACYVCASIDGLRGVVRISPEGDDARLFIAGARFVGIAFDDQGRAVLATNSEIYRVPVGVKGYVPTA